MFAVSWVRSVVLISDGARSFTMARRSVPVVVCQDEDGYWVGRVPGLHGAHSQARARKKLLASMKEAIALALEDEGTGTVERLVAVEKVTVEA